MGIVFGTPPRGTLRFCEVCHDFKIRKSLGKITSGVEIEWIYQCSGCGSILSWDAKSGWRHREKEILGKLKMSKRP